MLLSLSYEGYCWYYCGAVFSSKAHRFFLFDLNFDFSMWTDIGFLYCRNVWMYVYHWRGHVCHLGLLQVSWNFSCVDVVVMFKKVDYQAVKLKNALIRSLNGVLYLTTHLQSLYELLLSLQVLFLFLFT